MTRLYTSGTTGRQKGVPINNINNVFFADDVLIHFPLSRKDKTMNMTPWFHRGGVMSTQKRRFFGNLHLEM
ncbi:MAG TPA: AMP-binding protein [Balneolales bacterium]|nr:AMP-binding protein [Balneolales bacterium]